MCLNPLSIKNPRLDYRQGLHQSTIDVPCGRCDDCLEQRRNGFALRAMYEFQRWAVAVMLLFTYNEESLPNIYYKGRHMSAHYMPHMSELIRILRRLYGKSNFAYMVGSEYGTGYTFRPHYHVIFMLSSIVDYKEFCETARRIWTGLNYCRDVKQSFKWKYGNLGFMFPSPTDVTSNPQCLLCRDGNKSISYCAKYCAKQIGFVDNPVIKEIKKDGYIKDIKDYITRPICSRGFGRNMVNDKSFNLVDGVVLSPLTKKPVMIPSSIIDMIGYTRINTGKRRPVYDNKGVATGATRIVYERIVTDEYSRARLARLPKLIEKFRVELPSLVPGDVHLTEEQCLRISLYHYIYRNVPLTALRAAGFINRNGEQLKDLFSISNAISLYELIHSDSVDEYRYVAWDFSNGKFTSNYIGRGQFLRIVESRSAFEHCDSYILSDDEITFYEYAMSTKCYLRYQTLKERKEKQRNIKKFREICLPHSFVVSLQCNH